MSHQFRWVIIWLITLSTFFTHVSAEEFQSFFSTDKIQRITKIYREKHFWNIVFYFWNFSRSNLEFFAVICVVFEAFLPKFRFLFTLIFYWFFWSNFCCRHRQGLIQGYPHGFGFHWYWCGPVRFWNFPPVDAALVRHGPRISKISGARA